MKRILIPLVIIVAIWSLWSAYDRSPAWVSSELSLDVSQSLVVDSACTRNIVGIQPHMIPQDYLTEEHFYRKMKGYFDEARLAGYFKINSLVLLPEYLGTWLVICGEKESVTEQETITGAMTTMVLSNPFRTLRYYFITAGETDRLAAALFRMKAEAMAGIYSRVFQRLASEYGVTINAGSIVLPGAYVGDNTIVTDRSQPLYNTSFIIHPNGDIDFQSVRKSFPISSEIPFITAAPMASLPVYDLPVGRTAALVCADSWYPESYAAIKDLGAEIIVVNSYCAGQETMTKTWRGYDGGTTPGDVDTADVGKMTEGEAWKKYALPGRIAASGARIGVNVFLRGSLWDLGTDGQPLIVADGQLMNVKPSDRAGIWNLCY